MFLVWLGNLPNRRFFLILKTIFLNFIEILNNLFIFYYNARNNFNCTRKCLRIDLNLV